MNVTLIRIDAQDASGGAVPIRLSSHDIPEACHLGGEQWEPALIGLPDFALDFFGGGFAAQVTAPGTGFSMATTGLAAFGPVAANRARCADARVRIWVGDITSTATADLGPLTLRFDGRITGEPDIDDASRTARFVAAVKDSWADKPLLALFAGTGGIEGPADLTGQVKPLTLGNTRFVGGVLIDNVDNVWMVSSGPVQAVNAVYDRLASLGPSAGDFADLAALKTASIPNGSWGTCLALGLVRLGAPPDGRVSFDVSGSNNGTGGYVRRAGAMIRRIADLAGGTVNAASLTALDTARPYNLQLQLREQVTAREFVAQLADSVGAVTGISLTGELFAQALAIGTSGEALNADDSSAQRVLAVEELAKLPPNWRLATEAELTFEVHTADEAAFSYRWQGEWSAARVYRRDDVVTGPDGAAWAYINATPAAGQALPVYPATANSHWEVFQVSPSAVIAPANANRVPFSRMEGDRGWSVLFNPGALSVPLQYGTASGIRFARVIPTLTAPGQTFSFGNSSAGAVPLVPGERLSVQALVDKLGPATGTWQLEFWTFEADLVTGSQTVIASGASNVSQLLCQAFVDVPANRRFGRFELRFIGTGTGLAQTAIYQPMVTSAAPGQTVHPAFTPGPNAVDGALPNNLITIGPDGILDGIGTAGVNVDNRGVVLSGLLSARPASGAYIGQTYTATDAREFFRWDGFNWQTASDVTATAQVTTSQPAPFQVQANAEGVTTTDLSTQTRSIRLFRGGVAQTSGVTVGTPVPSTDITVASAVVSGGIVTVTLATANASGSVTVPVIFAGVTYNVTIPVTRTIAAPVAGGSGPQPFFDQSWSNITSTTYTQVTDAGATVLSTSGGQLAFSYSAQYNGGRAQCKAQYSANGTTWFDVAGSEVTGSIPITAPGEEEPGGISRSQVIQSGLDASTLYHVRLVARRTGGTGVLSWLAPTFTARQP